MVLLLQACTSTTTTTEAPRPVDVTQMPMEQVYEVSWDTEADGESVVTCNDGEVDPKEIHELVAPDGETHTVLLASLGEGTTWQCSATTGAWTSDPFTITTPSAPSALPSVNVTTPAPEGTAGFALTTFLSGDTSSVSIFDREGRRTWWYSGEPGDLFSQAWLSLDGRYVWIESMGTVSNIRRVSLDGAEDDLFVIPSAHHSFYPLEDGGFAAIVDMKRDVTVDGQTWTVSGDALAEYDADGQQERLIWNAWDTLELDTALLPPDESTYDWIHANSVTPAADGTWIISAWQLSLILRVNDADGSILWKVGSGGDFSFLGAGAPFIGQHGARLDGDTLRVFNNRDQGADNVSDLWSEAVEFHLDTVNGTYRRSWQYDADKLVYSTALGNLDPRGEGHRVIGWSTAGRIQELDAEDNTVWQLDADLGGAFGYTHILEELAGATR